MDVSKTEIIFIGSVCAGKSTQGKLIAEEIGKKSISLDDIASKYYEIAGLKGSLFEEIKQKDGFLAAYRQLKPFEAYATQQVLQDYPDCVIDFGAGHSCYKDKSLFESVQEVMSGYANVILLLPSPDLDLSISVLRQRSIQQRGWNWIADGYDFIEYWVKGNCNHHLATSTIYTEGKTPEETRDEILQRIR